ncbi:DinB family protein [Kibdelosporangium philippinense]|uniref:DinB family protein n=1 Tax=Kibdelosporangium philippinense TaxID=211113 RepID=A0ABS8ZKE4_9PSEU|nr:DinB family protein [Kibdelosporangium philippinense]MCE7008280.1 DinB family protein [Kibdelosporangium philippinense]
MSNDEKIELLAQLADARAALIKTTSGLSDEQAGEQPTASALCLGGLIKHVASTEEGWSQFIAGNPHRYDLPNEVTWADIAAGTVSEYPQWMVDYQNDFQMLPGETLTSVIQRYEEVAAKTAEIVGATDLSKAQLLPEAPWNEPGGTRSVRRVLMQLIAETSQHAGHADILRESIDGQTST